MRQRQTVHVFCCYNRSLSEAMKVNIIHLHEPTDNQHEMPYEHVHMDVHISSMCFIWDEQIILTLAIGYVLIKVL